MNEEKRNRIIAAVTVNVVILIAVLAAVLIYQMIVIPVMMNSRSRLLKEYNEYQEKIEQSENDLEYIKSEQYLQDLAFQYGYYYPED